jgi:hypothetical protein
MLGLTQVGVLEDHLFVPRAFSFLLCSVTPFEPEYSVFNLVLKRAGLSLILWFILDPGTRLKKFIVFYNEHHFIFLLSLFVYSQIYWYDYSFCFDYLFDDSLLAENSLFQMILIFSFFMSDFVFAPLFHHV